MNKYVFNDKRIGWLSTRGATEYNKQVLLYTHDGGAKWNTSTFTSTLNTPDLVMDAKVKYWQEHKDELLVIDSFNKEKWSEITLS
jgi:hypothetical protein